MPSPWLTLKPGKENPDLSCITIPTSDPCQYILNKTNAGFAIEELNRKTEEPEDGIKLTVDESNQLNLLLGSSCGVHVKINDQSIADQSQPLNAEDRVKLDSSCYIVAKHSERINKLKETLRELVKCSICLRVCKDARLLRCGHSFCDRCVQGLIDVARNAPQNDVQAEVEPAVVALFGEADLLDQTRTIVCAVCRQKFSCWEARRSIKPAVLTTVMKSLGAWTDFHEARPKCNSCRNSRGSFDFRDYQFCEDCLALLCSACVLDWHRGHKLRQQSLMLHSMHEAGKRVLCLKTDFKRMCKRLENVEHRTALNVRDLQQMQHKQLHLTHPVEPAMETCRKTLRHIQNMLGSPSVEPDIVIARSNLSSLFTKASGRIDTAETAAERFAQMLSGMKKTLDQSPNASSADS